MKLKFFFLFFCISLSVFAQQAPDADKYFKNKQYVKAKNIYADLLKQRPTDAFYNFRFASCCYELKDYETALKHFQLTPAKYPLRDLYVADLGFLTCRFDESVVAYQNLINALKPDDSSLKVLEQKFKKAEMAARLFSRVEDIVIVDSVAVNKADFLKFYKFSRELGSVNIQTLTGLNKTAHEVVKYTTQRQDRVFLSDTLKGHLDIFTSFKLLDEWSTQTSVSSIINTTANENYPFLLLDGVTLYFASDGENSIGGYDIFITRYNPSADKYLAPENIGMPFNSPFNDYMMVVDEQHQKGWFASDRYQPSGKVMIYSFVPNAVKTIIRSEDKEYTRRVAQLKSFRKYTKVNNSSILAAEKQEPQVLAQIFFVINDSVVYTSASQFKSADALIRWTEMNTLTVEKEKISSQLDGLRFKYAQTENEAERQLLAEKIVDFEKKIPLLHTQIVQMESEVRNIEIKYLQELLLQTK